jgi:hypothetical protein
MLTIAADLCRQITADHGGCRLSTNSGDHQSTKHLHFYIHSGSRIRDEHGVPIAGSNPEGSKQIGTVCQIGLVDDFGRGAKRS